MPGSSRISALGLIPTFLFAAQFALQGQSLMVGPTAVEFKSQAGSIATQQQSVYVLGNQTTSPVVSAGVSGGSWLTVAEPSFNLPKRIVLTANPAGLAAGTYTASVTLQNVSTPPLILPVTLVISTSSQLSTSRSSLQFAYHTATGKGTSLSDPTGAFLNTSSDQIVVSSSGSPLAYTASVSTADGANWLVAAPTTGNTPDPLVVRISPAGLVPGTYNGTITLQSPSGGTPVAVAVQLVVSANPYLAATPNSMNLAAYSGSAVPVTQALTLNSSGAVPYVIFTSAVSGGAWLSVSPANGNAPGTVTVSANAAGLPPGTYNGALQLTSSAAANPTLVIPVTLTVTLNPILSLSSSTLNFNFKLGDKDPSAPQTLNVTSVPAGANYTIKAVSPTGGAWFALGPVAGQSAGGAGSGTLPAGAITVQAAPEANMVPGTYFANVEVSGIGNTANARLVLTISSTSFLTLSPSDVTFNLQRPLTSQTMKQVDVKSSAAPLPFAVGEIAYTPPSAAWLRALTTETMTPGNVKLTVDPTVAATLADGTYTASVALDATTRINVTLNLSASRLLDLTPPELTFVAPIGGVPAPFQSLTATTTDGTSLAVNVAGATTSGVPWLLVASTGTTPANLSVGVNPAGLAVGRYEGTVTVSGAGANPPPAQRAKVTLVVPPAATLTAAPASLRFTKSITGTDPVPQAVSIASTGSAVAYSISSSTSDGRPWLQVTPVGGLTPGALAVSVNSVGLSPGNYAGTIAVSSPDASNSPLLIGVTFSVSQVTFIVTPSVVNFGAPAGTVGTITQQLQISSIPAGTIPFTASSTQPWLSVAASGIAPSAFAVTLQPATLGAGTYSATINLTATQGQAAPVAIPVNVVIGPTATLAITPATVSVTIAPGAGPQTANLNVVTTAASTPVNAEVRTVNGGNWLSVNPPSGFATPTRSFALILDPTGLVAGSYAGSIVLTAPNTVNSPITVPVTMIISGGRKVLSQIADGANWQTTITLVNMESTPASYTLRFYAPDGNALRLPIEGNPGRLEAYEGLIPGGGSRTIRTAGTDPTLAQGWAELETARQIGGLGIFRQRVADRPDLESAVTITNPANRFLLAFDNLQSYVTSMALVNTSTQQSRGLNIAVRSETGSVLLQDTINLPSRGQTAVETPTRFPITANTRGVLDMTNSGDFTGLGLRFNPTGAFTSFPVLTIPAAPVQNQLLSQLADGGAGGEWQTTIVLMNLDTQPAPYTLRFWAPTGAPLAVPIAGGAAVTVLDNTIPAGGTQTITTQGGSTPLITGWTELVSARAVGGVAVFRQRVGGRPDNEAGVTATASGRNFLLPYENTESFVTSMALVNTNSTATATIVVSLRDESGAIIGTESIVLGPRAQTSFSTADRFPALKNRRGVLEFTTTGAEISGLGLRFNPSGAFTSLPAMPK